MIIAVGLDIGNSTTEAVMAQVDSRGITVIATARAPTRGAKGTPESLDAAVALTRRLERNHSVRAEMLAVAPLRRVDTRTATLPEPDTATGRLRVVSAGARTTGGRGLGVGRPLLVEGSGDGPRDEAVRQVGHVAVVPRGIGFSAVIASLSRLAARGLLRAVVVGDDEAVLLANRLGHDIPVADEVPEDLVMGAVRVMVEVQEAGTPLRLLTDPLRVVADLGLGEDERRDAAQLAARLYDSSNAVVALDGSPKAAGPEQTAWITVAGAAGDTTRLPFLLGHEVIRSGAVGTALSYALSRDADELRVDDLWTVDLADVADTVLARTGILGSRSIAMAAIRTDERYADPGPVLTDRMGIPAHTAQSEVAAARLGALTTPGVGRDVTIVDLGGGTVDVVARTGSIVAAGAGELLTVSVAALTGATRGASEWVKRGPCSRVEAPQLLVAEDGQREFLQRPAPREAIGALVVRGPAGLLTFDRVHAPGEWRALRLRLKADILGGNLSRALRTLNTSPSTVVVVGGPAGDDEVLSSLSRVLPPGVAVGRGNAGGTLGHRYVVAYGLLLDFAGGE